MSDLVSRILDCVPAGTYALRTLFQLVDIVESDEIATAAVEGGQAPRMLVNPGFVERYAATPERLVMLVMHELHHIILGHTRLLPTSTRLDNIVFDAVINAMLCRAFPDPAGIAFFTDFYAADRVPDAILRPPPGWHPDDKHIPIGRELVDAGYGELARAHRGLYSPAGATYDEVREALETSCTEADAARVGLIGGHDEGGLHEGDLEDRAPVLLDVIREIVEQWPQPPEPIRGRSLADALQSVIIRPQRVVGNRARLRALLRWAGGLTERGQARAQGDVERTVASPLPGRQRRDVVAQLLGSPILLHEGAVNARGRTRAGERVHVYLDVSGSVMGILGVLTAAVRDCSEFVYPVVHGFSTKVADHSLADLAAGRVTSTWGTSIGCVAEHARRHGVKRAVVITDGYVGRARGVDAETLGGMRLAVAYTGGSCNDRDLAPFSGRHDTLEVS
jgi:hypothetical protein